MTTAKPNLLRRWVMLGAVLGAASYLAIGRTDFGAGTLWGMLWTLALLRITEKP